ncbi:hypothetical protein IJG96_03085 [Candidatus Saccharibacteria bacterium]|nr:hypothetical protein [Candidatus Saccharibacteria bacterium]
MLASGDDDGFVEVVVAVLGENKADVFGFVGGDALLVDKDAGVEAVFVAVEDDGAIGIFVGVADFGADLFEAEGGDGGLGVVFVEMDADFFVKIGKVLVG